MTSDAVPKPPSGAEGLVRAPRQERSRRTLDRILAAGVRLLRENGPEALTVTRITRRARTSVGSFYARFDGKDDLLRYLGERALEDTLARWDARAVGELPADRTEGMGDLVRTLGGLFVEGPGRTLALLDGVEDPAPTRRGRFEDRLAGALGRLSDAYGNRVHLAARVASGLLHDTARGAAEAGGHGPDGSTHLPGPDVLIGELTALLTAYLQAERSGERPTVGASAPSSHDVESAPDPFDIWA